MESKVITELTATNIVSLATLRNYLEFTATDATEDTLITTLLKAAIKMCEEFTGEAFGEKTVEVMVNSTELDGEGRITLPWKPFGVMTSVYSVDIEGTETAMVLNTDYYLNGLQRKSIKLMKTDALVGVDEFTGWYKIRYTAGYDISGYTEPIPENYKFAVMQQAKMWYEREFTGKLDKSIIKLLEVTSGMSMI